MIFDQQIGTYQAAVLAQRHNVPFMVVAPVTTVDLSLATGAEYVHLLPLYYRS